jgi:hypothetical protein
MTPTSSQLEKPVSPSAWKLMIRGIEVRLRFAFALLLLTGLMAGWPWLRFGWEKFNRVFSHPGRHDAVSSDTEYFCPMDPGVISAWPAICPVCNMDLITRRKSDAVILPEGVVARMQLSPYRVQLAGIRTSPVESRSSSGPGQGEANPAGLLIPASAVVHQGDEHIVYVETMPGMFDGIVVQVGPQDGDLVPILAGLRSGQRVVSAGAFLIDAESRLHPNLAVQYFGANPTSRKPAPPKRKLAPKSALELLSETDRVLVEKQQICPVTKAPLGSMGTPVFTMLQGRKVFLCCRGCEPGLLANPAKFLAELSEVGDQLPAASKAPPAADALRHTTKPAEVPNP